MPKVFLTNPPLNMAETPLQYHRPLVPLGIAYLGAVLEQHFSGGQWDQYVRDRLSGRQRRGYRASGNVAAQDNMYLSFYGKFSLDELVRRIRVHSEGCPPDQYFIGVSVLSDGMRHARKLLRQLRLHFPSAKLVVGGPHATFFPLDFYEKPESREGPLADYVVKNEGEGAILGIAQGQLETRRLLYANGAQFGIDPANCDFTDPKYRIIDGGQYGASNVQAEFGALDTLPTPAYFLFEDDKGGLPYEPDRRYGLTAPAANINSSRGCPHKCTFCTIPQLVPGYRTLSPRRMFEIAKFLSDEYSVQSLFFREDNFLYSGGMLEGDRWEDIEEFCDRLSAAHLGMRWAIEARADNLLQPTRGREPRIETLRRAGLTGVYMGIESGSDLMLKRYAKGTNVASMSEAVGACLDRGISVIGTACYSDPDLAMRAEYPSIDLSNPVYKAAIVKQREAILQETRALFDKFGIPLERREEYGLVGIPVSTLYRLLERERAKFPTLIEHYDTETRYLYPKGFEWWSTKLYDSSRRVRPYLGYEFDSA